MFLISDEMRSKPYTVKKSFEVSDFINDKTEKGSVKT